MDIAPIINTTISTLGVLGVAWIGYKVAKLNVNVKNYHKEVNGKMGQLLEVSNKASKAEGKLEEREERNSEKNS